MCKYYLIIIVKYTIMYLVSCFTSCLKQFFRTELTNTFQTIGIRGFLYSNGAALCRPRLFMKQPLKMGIEALFSGEVKLTPDPFPMGLHG